MTAYHRSCASLRCKEHSHWVQVLGYLHGQRLRMRMMRNTGAVTSCTGPCSTSDGRLVVHQYLLFRSDYNFLFVSDPDRSAVEITVIRISTATTTTSTSNQSYWLKSTSLSILSDRRTW
eukprot:269245-Rhodomonas_salina.1